MSSIVADPLELSMLRGVVSAICAERGLSPDSADADTVARDLLIAFGNGQRDKSSLMAIFREKRIARQLKAA